MVATRSTRASARLKKNQAVDTGAENMEDKVENNAEEEKSEGVREEDCIKCNEISNEPTKDTINEIIDSNSEELKDDSKSNKMTGYLKGFAKRVVLCTILVMAARSAWPQLQSRFWPEEPVKEGKLHILNDKSFRGHVSRGDHFVMMYAPWCGHCQRLKPDWDKIAKKPGVKGVKISKVDCTASTSTCSDHKVQGYPTLLYFRDGKKIDTYDGAKTLDGLKAYLKKMKKGGAKQSTDSKPTAEKPAAPVKSKKGKKKKLEL